MSLPTTLPTSLPTDSLLQEVSKIAAVKRMKTTANYALKSGAFVGATTVASGIVGGPVGLAIGGIVSSCIAGIMTYGKYDSVPYILLHETTPREREKLAEAIRKSLSLRHITTIRDFIMSIENDQQLVEIVIQILITFLSSEMGRKVICQ